MLIESGPRYQSVGLKSQPIALFRYYSAACSVDGLLAVEPFEVGFDLVEMHHVDIFMMEVEQIDFVNQFRAVVRALLDDRYMKSVRIGVHRAGADAA